VTVPSEGRAEHRLLKNRVLIVSQGCRLLIARMGGDRLLPKAMQVDVQ
jgi:hypothetical protein